MVNLSTDGRLLAKEVGQPIPERTIVHRPYSEKPKQ